MITLVNNANYGTMFIESTNTLNVGGIIGSTVDCELILTFLQNLSHNCILRVIEHLRKILQKSEN